MSKRVRVFLLAGCGLVAALEAPQAGSSFVAGLSGPYQRADLVRAQVRRAAQATALLSETLPATLVPLAVGATVGPIQGSGRGHGGR